MEFRGLPTRSSWFMFPVAYCWGWPSVKAEIHIWAKLMIGTFGDDFPATVYASDWFRLLALSNPVCLWIWCLMYRVTSKGLKIAYVAWMLWDILSSSYAVAALAHHIFGDNTYVWCQCKFLKDEEIGAPPVVRREYLVLMPIVCMTNKTITLIIIAFIWLTLFARFLINNGIKQTKCRERSNGW